MMQSQVFGSATGMKTISLGDFENWMDAQIDGGRGALPTDLYAAVAWTFWCVNLRADAVAQLPYKIYTLDSDEDSEENEVDFDIDLTEPLWRAEAWLNLCGAAYWLKRVNRVALVDLQVLNSTTMRIKTANADGPTLFEQKVGAVTKYYKPEELVYFDCFSPWADFGPGVASGHVGQLPGELIQDANAWAVKFFENGAVPAVLLTSEHNVPPNEVERIESRWNKALKGPLNWFKTIVMGHDLKADIIQPPIKDLAMPDLERTKREQILAAHKIPPGLAEAKTNRAERDALQFEFWTQCVMPEIKVWIKPAINKQLLEPMGLRIAWDWKHPEAIQAKELQKAESMSFAIAGVMVPLYQENLVSVDEVRAVADKVLLGANLPGLDATFTPEVREVVAPPGQGEQLEGGASAEALPAVAKASDLGGDLDKWKRMAVKRIREGNVGKALSFESDAIPAELHSLIVYGLDHAVTLGDVVQVFDAAANGYKVAKLIPDGADEPPIPTPTRVEISESDIDRALATWDRLMPEFAGLLDAEVIHKERYEAENA